jgi:hypothetical protein
MSQDPLFLHVRIVLSLILGLAITALLKGMVGFVQHPRRRPWSAIHLGWSIWALLSCVLVWWWEFELARVTGWSFELYAFELLYCSAYYALAALLYPDDIDEYGGFDDYILSRRGWLFGLIALITLLDIGDSLAKGVPYFSNLGPLYGSHIGVMLAIAAIGAASPSKRVHRALVTAALLYQIWYTLAQYARLGD